MGFNPFKILGSVAKTVVNIASQATIGQPLFKGSPSGPTTPPSQPVANPLPAQPQPSASQIAEQAVRAALDTVKAATAGDTRAPALPPAVGVAGIPTNMLLIGGGLLLVIVLLFAFQRR
jgi:hypothetical protein